MKISKLFHWLYAILMLLPFAFFVPSVLYYAFNDNSTMQTVEVPKTETISVDFNQKYNYVNAPNRTLEGITWSNNGNGSFSASGTSTNFSDYTLIQINETGHIWLIQVNNPSVEVRLSSIGGALTSFRDYINVPTSFYLRINPNISIDVDNLYPQLFDLTQMFGVGNEPTIEEFNQIFTNYYYSYTESELMQITYDTGTTEQLVENTSIINYAWESIWDLPLFSWTKVTFVSVPFAYLTGLFGIVANSSLNYLFGYFVTISICWLVFDVIMYVPMLVHRWIDKARIE